MLPLPLFYYGGHRDYNALSLKNNRFSCLLFIISSTINGISTKSLTGVFMKKFFLLFGLCLFSLVDATKNSNRPEAIPNKELTYYESFMRSFWDFIAFESHGFHAVKESTQQYINAIIHKLGMDDYCIEMRGMSNAAQHAAGRMNAFVVPSVFGGQSHALLFICEEWFESLPEEEKQGLVRHELMHIKCNHKSQKFVFLSLTFAMVIPFYIWCINTIENPTLSTKEKVPGIASYAAAIFAAILANAQFSQFCEKEADIKAAKTMKDKQG